VQRPHRQGKLTTVEPEILAELRGLRARVPHLTGGVVATTDGLVIAHDATGLEPEGMAALSAASLGVGTRLTETGGQGGFSELLARGEQGYVATYAAGASLILTVVGSLAMNVGRLHLEARRCSARIGELADGVPDTPERK
jgi:predicted regulator of Ras-like GTPase activity (Roadblock/LC7/MglB family)